MWCIRLISKRDLHNMLMMKLISIYTAYCAILRLHIYHPHSRLLVLMIHMFILWLNCNDIVDACSLFFNTTAHTLHIQYHTRFKPYYAAKCQRLRLELFLPDVVARCALITHRLGWDAWTYAINRSSVDTTVLLSCANISLYTPSSHNANTYFKKLF